MKLVQSQHLTLIGLLIKNAYLRQKLRVLNYPKWKRDDTIWLQNRIKGFYNKNSLCYRHLLNFDLVSAGIWILKLNIATGVLNKIYNIQIFSCFYLVKIWLFGFYFIGSSCSLSSSLIFCYSNVISITNSCINSTLFINKTCVPTTQNIYSA